jgi:hypothetical protein
MKVTVRYGVFETNSSSSHSISIVSKKEFEKWKNGEYVLNIDNHLFFPAGKNGKIAVHYRDGEVRFIDDTKANREKFDYDQVYQSYKDWLTNWGEGDYYIAEQVVEGVPVVAFGKYKFS